MTTDMSTTSNPSYVTLIAKYSKERITLNGLPPTTTIGEVKDAIAERTSIKPVRQKLLGITTVSKTPLTDDTLLSDLKVKKKTSKDGAIVHEFILMGTKEEEIFVDPSEKDGLPDVVSCLRTPLPSTVFLYCHHRMFLTVNSFFDLFCCALSLAILRSMISTWISQQGVMNGISMLQMGKT
jgi:hypothetical protein